MRIVVDVERCMGHGQCEIVAPRLFKLDDQGVVVILHEHPDESLRKEAELAAARCPEGIIKIEDD
ncbi:MAG TPA: ferredoxin [Hyphomicrobiales bacterium]|nr:ferredoxin [Hyphomicrobiales bacterium]